MVKRAKQLKLEFPNTHGGARKGARRKPKGAKALVSHAKRGEIDPRHPVLVTMKLAPGFRNLRLRPEYAIVRGALAETCARDGCGLIAYSVQANQASSSTGWTSRA